MIIFKYTNYRQFLRKFIENQPKKGWGLVGQIAEKIDMSAAQLSQVLGGKKELTLEQAYKISNYLHFTPMETEYWLTLVELDRASTYELKQYFSQKIENLKRDSIAYQKQVPSDIELTESQKGIFYSSWIYSAIRLFCSIKDGQTLESISERFALSRPKAFQKLEFLVSSGLCIQEGTLYKMGVQRTSIGKSSPFLSRHQMNWRWKALLRSEELSEKELIITTPLSLSYDDFDEIRNELLEVYKKISTRVLASKSEEVACLNIDFFFVDPVNKK